MRSIKESLLVLPALLALSASSCGPGRSGVPAVPSTATQSTPGTTTPTTPNAPWVPTAMSTPSTPAVPSSMPNASSKPSAQPGVVVTESAVFGLGCFWSPELRFSKLPGVVSTDVGYAGGSVQNPTYEQVCTGRTGHAEVVQVTFDPSKVSYAELVEIFFASHDPTQVNRQGPDVGPQYRSVIFYANEAQKGIAEGAKAKLGASGAYKRPIATEIKPGGEFYKAEEYHQDYLKKRGLDTCPSGG